MPDVSHTIINTRPQQLLELALPFLLGGEPPRRPPKTSRGAP